MILASLLSTRLPVRGPSVLTDQSAADGCPCLGVDIASCSDEAVCQNIPCRNASFPPAPVHPSSMPSSSLPQTVGTWGVPANIWRNRFPNPSTQHPRYDRVLVADRSINGELSEVADHRVVGGHQYRHGKQVASEAQAGVASKQHESRSGRQRPMHPRVIRDGTWSGVVSDLEH